MARDETYGNRAVAIGMRAASLIALGVSANAAAVTADDSFTGRWRMDTASLKGNAKPTVIALSAGSFRKDGGTAITADGRFHAIPGGLYVDETSITVADDHTVREVDKVHGKLAYTVDYVVSPDGGTLTWHVANYTNPDGEAVRSETVQRRVGPAPAGAHPISGRWQRVSVTVDAKSDWIITLAKRHFGWRTENGTGYDAIIGGPSAKIDGDNSGARAKVTRPRPDTIVETDYSARGRFDDVLSMQLMPGGMTIRGTSRSRLQTKPTTFLLHRVR